MCDIYDVLNDRWVNMAVPSVSKKELGIGDEIIDAEFNIENENGRALYLPDSESTTDRRGKRENLKEKWEKMEMEEGGEENEEVEQE
jgi:hypothetical protein